MIVSPRFAGTRFAVLGLARSGVATVEALAASGATVVAWDEKAEARDALAAKGLANVTLGDPLAIDLTGFNAVVVSPGVPIIRHPIRARADQFGLTLIGDIELFALARPTLPPHRVVGVTGTNGKSTTTALIHHLCRTAGLPSLMGGNIGLPILGRDPLEPNDEGTGVYVLELSSFQIDLTWNLSCDVAVLLNITPDHLDRYLDFESYAVSKSRLFGMQRGGKAVIADEDAMTREIAALVEERGFPTFRVQSQMAAGQDRWPSLQGPHNAQNAIAAIRVARLLGIDQATIEKGLATYPGLPHRMERVAEKAGVLYVNDSKATNPTSTAPALLAYPAVRWICGGLAKTDDLDACARGFPHVRKAYTIGEAAGTFERLLAPHMAVANCGTLEAALAAAAADAEPGDTVLLSPACASFDQFRDFETRGDAFRSLVEAL